MDIFSGWFSLLFWKGFYISSIFFPLSARIELLSPFRNLPASVCWKTSQTCPPVLQMYSHACRGTFLRIREQNARPFAHQLSSFRAFVLNRGLGDPSEAERLADTIYANPHPSFSLFILLPFLAFSLCLPLSLYLWLCSHSVIIQHRDPKKIK